MQIMCRVHAVVKILDINGIINSLKCGLMNFRFKRDLCIFFLIHTILEQTCNYLCITTGFGHHIIWIQIFSCEITECLVIVSWVNSLWRWMSQILQYLLTGLIWQMQQHKFYDISILKTFQCLRSESEMLPWYLMLSYIKGVTALCWLNVHLQSYTSPDSSS